MKSFFARLRSTQKLITTLVSSTHIAWNVWNVFVVPFSQILVFLKMFFNFFIKLKLGFGQFLEIFGVHRTVMNLQSFSDLYEFHIHLPWLYWHLWMNNLEIKEWTSFWFIRISKLISDNRKSIFLSLWAGRGMFFLSPWTGREISFLTCFFSLLPKNPLHTRLNPPEIV